MNAATRPIGPPKIRARREELKRMTDGDLAQLEAWLAKDVATAQSALAYVRRELKLRRRALRAGQ